MDTAKETKKRHLTAWGLLIRIALLAIMLWYFLWRIIVTLPYGGSPLEMVLGILLILCEFGGLFRLVVLIFNFVSYRESPEDMRVYETDQNLDDFLAEKGAEAVVLPDVDIMVTTCREPVEILEMTVSACMRLQYPEPEKVHVHLLDDADSPEMEKLAAKYGANYITREEHNAAKAGNLNNAMKVTHADLVVVFDADMVPHADFLVRTVPYFLAETDGRWSVENTRLGFLQTPQAFYTEDLYQSTFRVGKRIPNEQDQFYRNLQPCRSAVNAVICCGSNSVTLRKALEEVGFFTEETITEDFATGLKIQKAGYQSRAIDRTLAEGTTPENMRSLIRQRERWARGTIQTLKQADLFGRDFSWSQRFNHIASLSCWYFPFERLYLFIAPMLYPLFRIVTVHANYLQMFFHWLPMLILSQLGMMLIAGRNKNLSSVRWAFVYEFSLAPFLLLPVLKETVGMRKSKFEVTGAASKAKPWRWTYTIPFLVMLALAVISFGRTLQILLYTRGFMYLLLLIWQVVNLYFALLMTIFIFRVRDPKEKILGFDNLAHNLSNSYLPVYDLIRIILDPLIRRKEGYEDEVVLDYSVLYSYAPRSLRRKWFRRRLRQNLTEYGILALVLLLFTGVVRGKSPALIQGPVFEDLSRYHRSLVLSNWKNPDVQFLSDFSDRYVTFEDGEMRLYMDKNLNGTVTGSETQTWDFFGYGTYSVVMKPAAGAGVNSSFFTYTGPKDKNPWDEIDIEFPGRDTTTVQFNYYRNGVGKHEYLCHLDFDAAEDFHAYGYEWKEDSITWFVDGKAVHTVTAEETDGLPSTPGHIMMNLWAGDTRVPGMEEWLGKYSGKPATAYYKEFSYTPLDGKDG